MNVSMCFDNVGGEISQAVQRRLNLGARIVICGQVSLYNAPRPEPTFHPGLLVVFRARMEGFLVFDYAHRYDEAAARLLQWVANGDIHWREDVTEGLENAPRAFIGMLNGENQGKALVKVAGGHGVTLSRRGSDPCRSRRDSKRETVAKARGQTLAVLRRLNGSLLRSGAPACSGRSQDELLRRPANLPSRRPPAWCAARPDPRHATSPGESDERTPRASPP